MKYTDYYKHLLNESISLKYDGVFTDEQKAMAKIAVQQIAKEYDYLSDKKNIEGNIKSRYEFVLTKVRDVWSEIIFNFTTNFIGGREKISTEYSVEEKKKVFRTIENAIESIPKNENSVYRGMSFEEALYIKKTGYIKSKGSLNLGPSQEGYTFFGEDPRTAEFYSVGFQPFPLGATRNKPGVIIQIPKDYVEPAEITINKTTKRPVGSSGEWVTDKPISVNVIENAWFLLPTVSSGGSIDIIYNKNTKTYSEGSRFPPRKLFITISRPNFFKQP